MDAITWNFQHLPTGSEIHHYNHVQMGKSVYKIAPDLKEAGVPGVWKAFSALRPVAFRADIWRLVALWNAGGMYFEHGTFRQTKMFCSFRKNRKCDKTQK